MAPIPTRYEDLPPTPAEEMEARNKLVTEENERRTRLRLARDNRAAGHDTPRPGDKMYVSLDRTIARRRRGGAVFERGRRATIGIIDAPDDEVAAMQAEGNFGKGIDCIVNIWGAEQILADPALTCHQSPAGPEEVKDLRAKNDALETELAKAREEVARLRSARMDAPPSQHGEPSRLIAQRNAAAGGEFGKDPKR